MQTVTFNDARPDAKTQEPDQNTHVLRNLAIPASTFKYISEAAAYWRMDVDDFIVVTAWRQAAILAAEMQESSRAARFPLVAPDANFSSHDSAGDSLVDAVLP